MKVKDKVEMYKKIRAHGETLNKIFGTTYDPVWLCKTLRRYEAMQENVATCLCNGEITQGAYNLKERFIRDKVVKILGDKYPIILNGDPRGYGLKLDEAIVRGLWEQGINIFRDMGGYGILAPDFTPREY